MANKFLTLNIGAANIELAEYEGGSKGSLKLVNYGTAPLAAPLDGGNADTILSPAILEIMRTRGFKPGPIAVSVSGQMAFQKFAAIPMAGGSEKFEQMVRYEVEQGIPFPIDEMVCDRQVLGETENGDTSVMIVAAKVDQVEAITNVLSGLGFKPEIVDIAPLALVNAIRFNSGDDESCVVALDIGAKTTSLVIAEGDKVYTRAIPVAGNAVTKEIANALGCSTEEAEQRKRTQAYVSLGGVTEDEDETVDRIAKACRTTMTRLNAEISRSINFYRSQQHGSAPVRLYLTGGSALLAQIDQFFTDQLGIEVVFFNPFERIKIAKTVDTTALDSDAAQIAATVGLALHQVKGSHFKINLLPPSIVQAKAEMAKIPYLIAGGIGLVASLVLVGLSIGGTTAELETRLNEARDVESRLSSMAGQIKKATAELEEKQAEVDAIRALIDSRAKALNRLKDVRASLAEGMWITSWETKVDAGVKSDVLKIRFWKDGVKVADEKKTVGELVEEKLRKKDSVADGDDSVKTTGSARIADGLAEELTVGVKFK